MSEQILKTSKLNIMMWTTYDIANTIFSMGIVSMTVLQYGTLLGMANGLEYGLSFFLANIAVSISTLLVAITIPVMGTIADNNGKGKPGTILFGSLTILFTGVVFLFNNFFIAVFCFITANVFYQWGNLFYDTMIPRICQDKDTGWVSAIGVALGYFGSFFAVIFNFAAIEFFGEAVTLPDNIGTINPSQYESIGVLGPKSGWIGHLDEMWWLCALGFLLMALPFLLTKEQSGKNRIAEKGLRSLIGTAFAETFDTAKEVWKNKDMRWFVLGWFFAVDVVQTVIYIMKPAAVNGFGMGEGTATILLLVGVIFAVLLTGIAGPIADRKGPKFLAIIVCITWVIALAIPIFADSFAEDVELPILLSFLPNYTIFLMAILVGFGMGSIWVVQRTMTIELAPPDKIGQYFGFSKLAGKGSSAIGILLFGSIVSIFASAQGFGSNALAYKIGIFVLLVLFIIGFSFFMRVRDHHKEFLEGKRAPYDE
ncbi:MAG: MFS transporter [Candidatus Hodarchaeales archaeon]|jgi:UMF1 family MFS transporter